MPIQSDNTNSAEAVPESNQHQPITTERLNLNRTRMAADRTLMAWIRTALTMISFGFTLYKFIQVIQENKPSSTSMEHAPRLVGLTLIGLGTFALITACLQYMRYIKILGLKLRSNPWDMTFIIALLLGMMGLLMFFSIIINAGPFS
jgi:putative membrane protein